MHPSTCNAHRGLKQKLQPRIGIEVKFPCEVEKEWSRSPVRPNSVHQIRPGDIDVIAAMGDSLTAGNGAFAANIQQVAIENRGVSFTIGGQDDWRTYLTLPNILKEFNGNLVGYSLGDSYTHHSKSQFNVAEIGAMSQDLPHMARTLVAKIRSDKRVNFTQHWKLVSLMISSNNFCIDICYASNVTEALDEHRRNLLHAFEYLKDNMPRTIVNFIMSPNLKVLVNLRGLPSLCQTLRLIECPCLFALQHRPKQKLYFWTMDQWQRIESETANDQRFRKKDDFAIILQTFTKNITFPTVKKRNSNERSFDPSYMSYDCFHFSQKTYTRASNALWNNMLEPVGFKSTDWTKEYQVFRCPTKQAPYIYTWKNSQKI